MSYATSFNPERKHLLSELLPYDPIVKTGEKLPFALAEFSLLLYAAKNTIIALKKRDFVKLEALGADCNCHIRADIIVHIALKCFKKSPTLATIQQRIDALSTCLGSTKNLKELLVEGLDLSLREDELFLIQCHLLWVIKKTEGTFPDMKEKTSLTNLYSLVPLSVFWEHFKQKQLSALPKNFCNEKARQAVADFFENDLQTCLSKLDRSITEGELLFVRQFLLAILSVNGVASSKKSLLSRAIFSSEFKDDLIKEKLRSRLTSQSVDWVQRLAKAQQNKHTLEMLSDRYIVKYGSLKMAPTYWTWKSLLNRLPIVFWHQQFDKESRLIRNLFYYVRDRSFWWYYPSELPYSDRLKPIMVVHSFSKITGREITKNELSSRNLSDLTLACFAVHRQYLKDDNEDLVSDTQDDTFARYQRRKDPDFNAVHIFPAVPLKDLKGISYDKNFLKKRYGHFYREYDCLQLKKLAQKIDVTIETIIDGEQIIVKTASRQDWHNLSYEKLFNSGSEFNLLHEQVAVQDVTHGEDEAKQILKLNLSKLSEGNNLLSLARAYKDPARFLIDHSFYWPKLGKDQFIRFLTSQEGFLVYPKTLDILADIILEKEEYFPTLMAAIEGVGKALMIPQRKQRAVNLLSETANYYAVGAFYLYDTLIAVEMRSAARKELQKLIEEPYIRLLFQKMALEEPLLQLKFDLMNALEGIASYKAMLLETIHYLPEYYKDLSLSTLQSLIESEETAKSLRIVALRHLADYFFRGVEHWEIEFYDIETNGYGPDLLINNAVRKKLFLFLKELIELSRLKDPDIAKEAQQVYQEIVKHLQVLDQSPHPLHEIAKMVTSLVGPEKGRISY